MHLHSLGILHRDLRAANILIAGLDPLHVMVADFGVSHILSAFAAQAGDTFTAASKVTSVLMGAAGLGPLQVRVCLPWLIWCHLCCFSVCRTWWSDMLRPFTCCFVCRGVAQWTAPEVRAGSEASGAVVTTASDVYMVGGLAYELLTCGVPPFHWLMSNPTLLVQRLSSAEPVEIPDTDVTLPGLLHKNVLEAAVLSRKPIPWCVQADATPGSGGRLEEVKSLMASCLALGPEERPKLPNLHQRLSALLAAEVAEARALGTVGTPVSSAWRAHVVAHTNIACVRQGMKATCALCWR
jgi:serine/threonine protein kinase